MYIAFITLKRKQCCTWYQAVHKHKTDGHNAPASEQLFDICLEDLGVKKSIETTRRCVSTPHVQSISQLHAYKQKKIKS